MTSCVDQILYLHSPSKFKIYKMTIEINSLITNLNTSYNLYYDDNVGNETVQLLKNLWQTGPKSYWLLNGTLQSFSHFKWIQVWSCIFLLWGNIPEKSRSKPWKIITKHRSCIWRFSSLIDGMHFKYLWLISIVLNHCNHGGTERYIIL